jgi:hypothetical protein
MADAGADLRYTENLSRAELARFVRFYALRDAGLRILVVMTLLIVGLGVGALLSESWLLAGGFVGMVTISYVLGVIKILWGYRNLKVYGQAGFPQEFTFSENGIAIRHATGIHVEIPWRHVRKIYHGRDYVYFATAAGNYWVHKGRFAEHLVAVERLWRERRAAKPV